jgi:MerR family transcriptional regulator, copper efflux regulator
VDHGFMKIGEVAERLGVAVHVLRHWDEQGVVVPERTAAGHRVYTEEQVYRLRVLQACQGAGMSLAEIRHVLHRNEDGRAAVIQQRLTRIQTQRAQLEAAETFLTHVVNCEHDLLTRCRDCTEYASGTTTWRLGRED